MKKSLIFLMQKYIQKQLAISPETDIIETDEKEQMFGLSLGNIIQEEGLE